MFSFFDIFIRNEIKRGGGAYEGLNVNKLKMSKHY